MSDMFQAYVTVRILCRLLKIRGLTKLEYHFKGGQNIPCSVEDSLWVVHNTNNVIGTRSGPIGVFSGTLCSSAIFVRKFTVTSKPGSTTAKVT
jgi:hypothetical protein